MKILTIMGGPRKGYGTICMEKFEHELKLLQDVDFEYLYLKDVHLESCIGCLNCFFIGEDKCPFVKDDRDYIINKINEADGVIFMAPTYAFQVPAVMKNFFDRLSYIFHRPRFFGKIAIGISNQGINGAKHVTKYFKLVADSWGFKFVNRLELRTVPYGGAEERMTKKIQKTCRIFLKALNGQRYQKPSLGNVLAFRIRKLLYSQYWIDETNADYKYWLEQGWLDDNKKHYYDVKIGIRKKIIASLISAIVKPKFKSLFPEDPKRVIKRYLKLESLKFEKEG
ncbi:MAG: flavodoxin family protein [Candidatus Hodarchaeota archaeon]